ncbi:MAG: radical SAM protein, partial [Candidatus Omnitrophota bacterium]
QDLNEILEAVSFVDRIIFGRLNYNVKSSEFKYTKEFYNSSAASVVKFCRKNGIDYHIKHGTRV